MTEDEYDRDTQLAALVVVERLIRLPFPPIDWTISRDGEITGMVTESAGGPDRRRQIWDEWTSSLAALPIPCREQDGMLPLWSTAQSLLTDRQTVNLVTRV
jgi:hypothetical protein